MSASIRDVYTYLVTTLGGDSTLISLGLTGVFAFQAPEQADLPYIILQRQSGVHEFAFTDEAYSRHYLMIKAVTEGTDGGKSARQISDRAAELISGQRPTIASGYVASIRPKTDIEYIEAEAGGVQFMHVGTVYEIFLGNN